jgi:DNA polymerase III subunit gamma/tau
MSVALYRKYRPKSFSDVTNQNHIKITLQNEIENDRLGHAYLFCGPRGTGKTTIARLLSKAVNCLDLQPSGEACNKCEICQEVLAGKSLDIIEIDAASHTGVENVRENIINNARFTPSRNKYKVFIIDEVHMLSISAFNALLKTLEEPPKYVIFILATTEAHKVPATIISRCQRFDFKKIIVNELMDRLRWISGQEEISVDDKVLKLIAKQAGGCVRDAESLLEQVFALGEKNISLEQAELILPKVDFDLFFELFDFIIKKNKVESITLINKLVGDGVDIARFTDNFVEFIRKVLMYKVTEDLDDLAREVDETVMKSIRQVLPTVTETFLIQMIEKCLINKDLFKQNYLAQLPLEVTTLELCSTEPVAMSRPFVSAPPTSTPNVEVQKKTVDLENKTELTAPSVTAPKVEEKAVENLEKPAQTEPVEEIPPAVVAVLETPKMEIPADLGGFVGVWTEALKMISQTNYSLFMSLKMGKAMSFSGDKLTIGFLFELHRSRVDDPKSKLIIREVFAKLLNKPIVIEVIVDPRLSLDDLPKGGGALETPPMPDETPGPPQNEADKVAGEFGGTVVEQ